MVRSQRAPHSCWKRRQPLAPVSSVRSALRTGFYPGLLASSNPYQIFLACAPAIQKSLGSSWDPVSLGKPTSIQASLPPLPQPSTPIPSSAEPRSISQTGSCVPSNTSCDRAHATPIHPFRAALPLHLYHPQVSRQSHVNVARPGLPPSPALSTGRVPPLPGAPRARERSC